MSDKIDYIFSATLDVVLSIHRTRQAVRQADRGNSYFFDLTQENVPVYQKADKASPVVEHTPPGLTRITTNYSIQGLNGDGPYWHAAHFEGGYEIWGYIHCDYVKQT